MQSAPDLTYDIEQGSVTCAIQRGVARTPGLEFMYEAQLHHTSGESRYIDSLVPLWSQSQRSFLQSAANPYRKQKRTKKEG
jgi:hypothetical protein